MVLEITALHSVKINKGNLTAVKSGGQKRKLSKYHSRSITDPNRMIFNREGSSITSPNRKRCTLHLLQEINYPSNSVNEKSSSP